MKHANVAIFVPHIGCPNRCSFCNQNSISGVQQAPDAALVTQTCTQALAFMGQRAQQAEIAFFGGSFTAIDRHLMLALLDAANAFVKDGSFAGIRISTRPDAIDAERLELLRQRGVTAIELGAQSMDDEVLRKNRRGHTAQAVAAAAEQVHRYGFELGLQMMVGLYGDDCAGTYRTAQLLADLHPHTMRIYPTVVIQNTMLAELYEQGLYSPLSVQEAVQISADLLAFFEERQIRVIRVGLHASRLLEQELLAGGYHPALRELCEAELYLRGFRACLEAQPLPQGRLCIQVAQGCISKATGQHGSNLQALQQLGYSAKITEAAALRGRAFQIQVLPGLVRPSSPAGQKIPMAKAQRHSPGPEQGTKR